MQYRPGKVALEEGVDSHHEQRCEGFDHQKLENVLLAAIRKVLCFLPASQLIRFLAIVERPEVAHLLFVGDHDLVQLLILNFVLHYVGAYLVIVEGEVREYEIEELEQQDGFVDISGECEVGLGILHVCYELQAR